MTAIASAAPGPATARGGRGSRRGVVVVVLGAAVAIVVVLVLLAPGRTSEDALDPYSTGPTGTKAVVELARQLDADVSIGSDLPDDDVDVAVMFDDVADERAAGGLRRWVRDGGTLVVAAPASELAPLADASARRPRNGPDTCAVEQPEGLRALRSLDPQGPAYRFEVPDGARGCFVDDDGAFVVVEPTGDGLIVSVGSSWVFTNDALALADDAGLAAALLVPEPGTRLQVLVAGGSGDDLAGPDGAEPDSTLDLLPVGVGLALVELAAAFVLYVLHRSRRLGAPVAEGAAVTVAGSELVRAVGSMLSRSGARDRAADQLRRRATRRLAERFGQPTTADPEALASVVASRSAVDRERLLAALRPTPVPDDAALTRLADELDRLVADALRG